MYFYDNGVRNMLIGNFNPIDLRLDKGALWENFLVAERVKLNAYSRALAKPYFWRTTRQQEVDYLEMNADQIKAFEFKWQQKGKHKVPVPFAKKYTANVELVSRENFRQFVM